jgi:hypothetical protein
MPFNQLLNAQQVEASIAGPGDTNRLYLCSGLAQGYFSLTAQSGQWQNASDIWQFGVGPQLDAGQFRRATATASFAGLQESDPGPGSTSWAVQMVFADFDDDSGKVRVSVQNTVQVYNQMPLGGGEYSAAGVSTLAYTVSILAAIPA